MSGNINSGNQPSPQVQQDGVVSGCINYGNLPPLLVQYGLICGWGYRLRPGSDKMAKVPLNLTTGQPADPTDPTSFAPLSIAVNSNFDYRKFGYDGLGLGIFGNIGAIDIDHIIDDNGEIAPMGKDIINTMDSYTEISPSGHGIRILFLATNFQYDKARHYINNQKIGLEVYVAGCTSKYVSITGNAIHLRDLAERGDRLQIVLDKYMQRPVQNSVPVQAPVPTVTVEDNALIDIICNSKNGEKFKALMSGDTSEYGGDDSSADLGLCNILAFFTARNAEQMDRIFRRSKLMRDKWDSARGDSTYGKDTIAKAIAGTQQVYTPKNVLPVSDPVATAATITATTPVIAPIPTQILPPPIVSAPDLENMSFPAVRYLVEKILSMGTSILVAPSKLGKSWLVLYMGLCIAAGIPWMGYATMQCGVLYCALEDSMSRLQDRMRKVLNGIKPPEQFYFLTDLPTVDNGLFKALDQYLAQYPNIKLIIIDTLQKVRGKQSAQSSLYAYDYRDMGAFQKYALTRGVAFLFVHHTRKMQDPDDVFNTVSGSTGIMGAADTIWVISKKRNAEIATLNITGREVRQESLAIKFNQENFHWEMCGTSDELEEESARAAYRCSPIVRAVKKLLYDSPDNKWTGFSSALIKEAKVLGIDIEATSQKVGKFIQQNRELFEELDQIAYEPIHANGSGSIKHKFKYVTNNVDPDDSAGVDPAEAEDDDLDELLPFRNDFMSTTTPESSDATGVEL